MQRDETLKFSKKNHLFNKVIFVDGPGHSGKILLGPILSTYKNVEIPKHESIFEHLAVVYHYGKITIDAAVTLMRIYLDMSLYHSTIGRNINFRPSDFSSVFLGGNLQRYLGRLFMPEGEEAVERIVRDKYVSVNQTHEILGFIQPCFEAFGESLYVVEVMRHPADVAISWMKRGWGDDRFGWDPRSFIISFEYQGEQIPYFSESFKESYHAMTSIERVIHCIKACTSQIMKTYSILSPEQKEKVLFVKFEPLVTNSEAELNRIMEFLGLEEGEHLSKVMAEQRVPRTLNFSERDVTLAKYLEEASASAKDLLSQMIYKYEMFNLSVSD